MINTGPTAKRKDDVIHSCWFTEREEIGGGDSEAERDVGTVTTFYWNVAAEVDNCSKRLPVASEERKERQVLCQMR